MRKGLFDDHGRVGSDGAELWDDQPTREHALARRGLVSGYHAATDTTPRNELPTMWTAYKKDKPHHIDYVYAPASWIVPGAASIGAWDDFAATRLSDHAPVVVTLD